ncbi:LytR/AlgR family response regulator transcription factor [Poritiphilus flavus]|uniref:Response regulator n=1 Tax=Poritiphilus flavus TaxID=2697053 RepID=A0A6L9EH57_9FLAO|nr:LytTR family DNA-binding domain-containing protein [Poritiphilus flavus]NAS13972.1 response regulator [Poritiphilus flavus]
MPVKCMIIDDEPLAIQVIAQHLEKIEDLELKGSFQKPLDAFEMLKTQQIDLIFLDIQMPLLSGIDLIKSLPDPPAVIFTTAHRDYALESYELNIVDYLLKPISFTRFFRAVNKYRKIARIPDPKVLPKETEPVNDHIYVNANKKYVKVLFKEITHVESIKDYIRIHTTGTSIITKDKISEFERKLPDQFLRVHRSYIVNTTKISAFTAKDIEIGRTEVPIGDSYKKAILSILKRP